VSSANTWPNTLCFLNEAYSAFKVSCHLGQSGEDLTSVRVRGFVFTSVLNTRGVVVAARCSFGDREVVVAGLFPGSVLPVPGSGFLRILGLE
jgi:hypothetical protein